MISANDSQEEKDFFMFKRNFRRAVFRKNYNLVNSFCTQSNLTDRMIRYILNDFSQYHWIREYIVKRTDLSQKDYEKLYKSKSYSVINQITLNPTTPSNVLVKIYKKKGRNSVLTVNLLKHPNFPEELKAQIILES